MQMAGVPDICGVYEGLSIWCETKIGKNKLSKIQEAKIAEIRKAGGLVVVAYSLEEAVELITHIGLDHNGTTCYGHTCESACPYV